MYLHHVGYVVRDIEAYARGLPGLEQMRVVDDPLQHARLALYGIAGSSSPYVELIQPLIPEAFTWQHLDRAGEGLHHICYGGLDEAGVLALICERRMLKVRGPIPAVLFGRDVIFAVTQKKAIVEFVL